LKGLRLVVVYALAASIGALWDAAGVGSGNGRIGILAGGFALWGSASEARPERPAATRDLVILCAAAMTGAIAYASLAPLLQQHTRLGCESALVTGAFLVAYLKRFGMLGASIGSQIYLGELLAFGVNAQRADTGWIGIAGVTAALSCVLPRWLMHRPRHTGTNVRSEVVSSLQVPSAPAALLLGTQTAAAALLIVALASVFDLTESAWAITACVYIVTATRAGTLKRARQRVLGTLVGVPIGLICMPLAAHAPTLAWILAGCAMVVYAVSASRRYDIACAAFAFTLMVVLEVSGQHSVAILCARIWETMLGAALGVAIGLLRSESIQRASGHV